jgi:hypothetical protein
LSVSDLEVNHLEMAAVKLARPVEIVTRFPFEEQLFGMCLSAANANRISLPLPISVTDRRSIVAIIS